MMSSGLTSDSTAVSGSTSRSPRGPRGQPDWLPSGRGDRLNVGVPVEDGREDQGVQRAPGIERPTVEGEPVRGRAQVQP